MSAQDEDRAAAVRRLAGLLDRIDRDGPTVVAAELGEHDRELAYPVLLGHVTAAARAVVAEEVAA